MTTDMDPAVPPNLNNDSHPSSSTTTSLTTAAAARAGFAGNFRWVICAVLLLGVTKNYMDRQILSVLNVTLQQDLGWSEIDYGNLVFAFQAAYALGLVVVGRWIDKVGTRIGYALAMASWSLASLAGGLAHSLSTFWAARFALGFCEAGAYPASLKATAEWFPRRERALATGIFNAGSNVGAVAAGLIVPWIAVRWGWRSAFFVLGGLGFVGLALWLWLYRRPQEHARCTPEELNYICSDPVAPSMRVSWLKLLAHRQTWAFVLGKFITDPVWWFCLYWIPDFLQRKHGLALLQIGLPIGIIYLMADAGSIAGGWLSSSLIRRGRTVNASRKLAMLTCALIVLPIVFTPTVKSTWGAVLLLGLATAAHQGFSTNLFTLPSDMFPGTMVASVVGIGGMAGAVGGMLVAKIVSWILERTHSYALPFLCAATAYLIALAVIQALVPTIKQIELDVAQS